MISVLFLFLLTLACIAVMIHIRRVVQEMNDVADLYDDEDLEDPWDL